MHLRPYATPVFFIGLAAIIGTAGLGYHALASGTPHALSGVHRRLDAPAHASTHTLQASAAHPTASIIASSNAGFPGVIQDALGNINSSALAFAMAPTVLPQATSGYALTDMVTSHAGQVSGYRVGLMAGGEMIAEFSGEQYPNATDAAAGFAARAGLPPKKGGASSTISLSGGQSATQTLYTAPPGEPFPYNSARIHWTQDGWTCLTGHYDSHTPLTQAANVVASTLANGGLNVAKQAGAIQVSRELTSPPSDIPIIQVWVTWLNGDDVYQVITFTTSNNPVATAMAMANSMRP
ncbi:MAG: hypothetical protein OWS74_06890 [Firmicutes bacterium]|nr:hypothetical protein [Bacillota bacterium]